MNYKYLIVFIIGVVIGLLTQIPSCNPKPQVESKKEFIHDTILLTQDKIVEKTKIKYINTIDTFYIVNSDTVYVESIPIEYKVYQDSLKTDSTQTNLQINFHGFDAAIDSIKWSYRYTKENKIINNQPKKFGLDLFVGPSMGYSVGVSPQGLFYGPTVGISVGVGFGYRIK